MAENDRDFSSLEYIVNEVDLEKEWKIKPKLGKPQWKLNSYFYLFIFIKVWIC